MQMLRILIKALRIMEMGYTNGNEQGEGRHMAIGRVTVLGSLGLHVLPAPRFALPDLQFATFATYKRNVAKRL